MGFTWNNVYSPFNVYFSIYIYILGLSNVFGSDERSKPETLTNKQNKPIQTAFQNKVKELSLCHKLWFLNPNFFETKCCRP